MNWELLITDDCSSDNTREVVEGYCAADPRIKLLRLEKNSGAGVARNSRAASRRGGSQRFRAGPQHGDR